MSEAVQNPGYFLAGIAGLLRNAADEYLLLKRSDDRDFGASIWECVTGRVNQGEGFEEALRVVFGCSIDGDAAVRHGS